MKFWLSGVALLLASSSGWADNYRFVQSPSQKLDIWIDNIKSNSPQNWCARALPLRIVANGDQNPAILNALCHALARCSNPSVQPCNGLNGNFMTRREQHLLQGRPTERTTGESR